MLVRWPRLPITRITVTAARLHDLLTARRRHLRPVRNPERPSSASAATRQYHSPGREAGHKQYTAWSGTIVVSTLVLGARTSLWDQQLTAVARRSLRASPAASVVKTGTGFRRGTMVSGVLNVAVVRSGRAPMPTMFVEASELVHACRADSRRDDGHNGDEQLARSGGPTSYSELLPPDEHESTVEMTSIDARAARGSSGQHVNASRRWYGAADGPKASTARKGRNTSFIPPPKPMLQTAEVARTPPQYKATLLCHVLYDSSRFIFRFCSRLIFSSSRSIIVSA